MSFEDGKNLLKVSGFCFAGAVGGALVVGFVVARLAVYSALPMHVDRLAGVCALWVGTPLGAYIGTRMALAPLLAKRRSVRSEEPGAKRH